jgi:hypothetical protein
MRGGVEGKTVRSVVYFAETNGSFGEIQCDTSRFSPSNPSGYVIYRQFNTHKPYVLPTQTVFMYFVWI